MWQVPACHLQFTVYDQRLCEPLFTKVMERFTYTETSVISALATPCQAAQLCAEGLASWWHKLSKCNEVCANKALAMKGVEDSCPNASTPKDEGKGRGFDAD